MPYAAGSQPNTDQPLMGIGEPAQPPVVRLQVDDWSQWPQIKLVDQLNGPRMSRPVSLHNTIGHSGGDNNRAAEQQPNSHQFNLLLVLLRPFATTVFSLLWP